MHDDDLSPAIRPPPRLPPLPPPLPLPATPTNKAAVLTRLRRVEGQVRGLQRMVEDDRYCIEVLEQISAASRALQAVALQLLDDHMAHCVADAVRAGGDVAEEKLAEASAAVGRLVRS